MRYLRIILLTIVLVFVGVSTYYYVRLPHVISNAIEQEGVANLGVVTKVDNVKVAFLKGEVMIDNIVVHNIKDFSDVDAIKAQGIFMKMQPLKMFADIIVLDELLINDLQVQIEANENGMNLAKLKRHNINAIHKQLYRNGLQGAEKDGEYPKRKVLIKDLEIRNFIMRSIFNVEGDNTTVHLENIIVQDVGVEEDGLFISQLTKALLDIISTRGLQYMKVLDVDYAIENEVLAHHDTAERDSVLLAAVSNTKESEQQSTATEVMLGEENISSDILERTKPVAQEAAINIGDVEVVGTESENVGTVQSTSDSSRINSIGAQNTTDISSQKSIKQQTIKSLNTNNVISNDKKVKLYGNGAVITDTKNGNENTVSDKIKSGVDTAAVLQQSRGVYSELESTKTDVIDYEKEFEEFFSVN